MPSVLQPWVEQLTLMQQSVLLTGVRGPDGVSKDHLIKQLVRAYRRAILISAFDKRALDPHEPGGGNFTGPLVFGSLSTLMRRIVNNHDDLPHHYLMHLIHCTQIVGVFHPDRAQGVVWNQFYYDMCRAFHMGGESHADFHQRLSDQETAWRRAAGEEE